MTTHEMIKVYARFLNNATHWQTQADAMRDRVAKRLLMEGNFNNGSRATLYKVKKCVVRTHDRSGHRALRITP